MNPAEPSPSSSPASTDASLRSPDVPDGPDRIRGCRVLVVDDAPLMRSTVAALLSHIGFLAIEADGAREALSVLERCAVDIVLTDLWMPDMTGLHLAERIRGHWPHIPVVLMTGVLEGDREEALENPAVAAVIVKPFRIQDLQNVLERALQESSPPQDGDWKRNPNTEDAGSAT